MPSFLHRTPLHSATHPSAHTTHAGHLYSCAADLRPYLVPLQGDARAWLLEQLHQIAGLSELGAADVPPPVSSSEAQLRCRISALQVGVALLCL